MNSIRISIEAHEEQQEILISELAELGAEGFEQTDTALIAYFPEQLFRSYEVNEALKGLSFHTETVAEKNWNEEWEKNFQPVVVDDFCAVRAEFHEPISTVEHEIIITPKMSFGTGHHATTYLVMQQMREIDFRRKTVFDFGTGTGILAILAEKLGAVRVTAIDIDEWSIRNAGENTAKNGCTRISLSLSSQLPRGKFDVILANINRNVILQYLTGLKELLSQNGLLVLSGLLVSDREDILSACEQTGLRLLRGSERNNWISLMLLK